MTNYFTGESIGNILNYSIAVFLLINISYIIYSFFNNKVYYDNVLASFAIYFIALFAEPITISMKFNAKYGFEMVELIYIGIILYIVFIAIFANNNYIIYNLSRNQFSNSMKTLLGLKNKEYYLSKDKIYIENDDINVAFVTSIFYNNAILLKSKNISQFLESEGFNKKIASKKKYNNTSRFYYLAINIIITIILLINLRY